MSVPQHPRSDRRPLVHDDVAQLEALVNGALATANESRPLSEDATSSLLEAAERFGARRRQGGADIVAIAARFQDVRFGFGISTALDRRSRSVLDAVLVAIVRGFESPGDGESLQASAPRRVHTRSGPRFERRIHDLRHRRAVHR